MAIEFHCAKCNRLLRVPDGTDGKRAKCPHCAAVVLIPNAVAVPPAAPKATPMPPQQPTSSRPSPPVPPPQKAAEPKAVAAVRETIANESGNPYQAPQTLETRAEPFFGVRGFQPTHLPVGEAISRTWKIFKSNLLMCVFVPFGTVVLLLVALSTFSGIVGIVFPDSIFIAIAMSVLTGVVLTVAMVFLMAFMLRVARGERAEFQDLFRDPAGLVQPIITTFAMFAAVFAMPTLVLLLAVLGVLGPTLGIVFYLVSLAAVFIIGLMLSQAVFISIDHHPGVFDSLRMSAQATNGNLLPLLGAWFLTGLICNIINVLTCFVGALVTPSFQLLLACVIYLLITGQNTGALESDV